MKFRGIFTGVIALGVAASPANAAVTLATGDVGSSFTIDYTGQTNGMSTTLLDSSQTFTLTDVSVDGVLTNFSFAYTLDNTTDVAARIRSFGFNVLEPLSAVIFTPTDLYGDVGLANTFPEGQGVRDICFRAAGGSNCTGGPNGLLQGESTTGTFVLGFEGSPAEVTLSDFVVRYQSIDPAVNGATSGVGIGMVTSAIPEPGAWAMMILGFGMLGASMRRRAKVTRGLSLA